MAEDSPVTTVPAEILELAQGLLKRTDPETAGLWPRAAALLALEATLDDFWLRKGVRLDACWMRSQLVCLEDYVDREVAGRVHHAWGALSRACHHHPYELAPSVEELQSLVASVSEFQAVVAATAR